MAWSTPRTWSVGEILTAANFNTFLRDQQTHIRTITGNGDPVANTILRATGAGTSSWSQLQTGDIADLAVTAAKIANDTITAAQVAPDAIGASELAANAVDTAAIVDLNVTGAKLETFGPGAVTKGSASMNAVVTTDAKGRVSTLTEVEPSRKYAKAKRNSTEQSIANNTRTTITFEAEQWDTDGFWEGATNPSRVTLATAGKYRIVLYLHAKAAGAALIRYGEVIAVLNNLNNTIGFQKWTLGTGGAGAEIGSAIGQTFEIIDNFAAGDYVELRCLFVTSDATAVALEGGADTERPIYVYAEKLGT